jgi:two-component sensor histidine kinase
LIIADNGVGLSLEPDIAHTSSLGLQLVETLFRQLGGRLAVDLTEGTAFRITFAV